MVNPIKLFDIREYIEIFFRRIWWFIVPFFLIVSAVTAYALLTPKSYRASTTILVSPQKIPVEYVRPTVTSKIEDRLQSIGQEILSRTRLEVIIKEFNLFAEEAKTLTTEEIVEKMRKNISVDIKGKEGFFSISYIGEDPRMVARVANKLASLYIEENLRLREFQAQSTTEFLAMELKSKKELLDEQERTISNFKKQYMSELPEQRDVNLRIMERLQRDQQRASENLKAAQERKLILQKQIAELKIAGSQPIKLDRLLEEEPAILAPLPQAGEGHPSLSLQKGKASLEEVEVEKMKVILADLQAKYKEKHPDVITIKKRLKEAGEKLEARRKELEQKTTEEREKREKQAVPASAPALSPPTPSPETPIGGGNIYTKELESQLVVTEGEIKRLREEDASLTKKIAVYQDRIDNTPLREITAANLLREFNTTKGAYEILMKKSQDAQQAENLERRQKGEQFKIIDPARVPEKPFKPNIPLTLLFGILFGGAAGIGLALFKEGTDPSFRNARDLEATMGIKVIANVPRIA